MKLKHWLDELTSVFPRRRTRRRKNVMRSALSAEVLEARQMLSAAGFSGGVQLAPPVIDAGSSGGAAVDIGGLGNRFPGGNGFPGGVDLEAPGSDVLDKIGTPDPDVAAATEAIAFGDFNGDGYEDMAIGMPDKDVGTAIDAGAVRVLYGIIGGLQADSPNVAREYWTQDDMLPTDAETGDHFGGALAAGDFNGDGKDDLAIGSPGEDSGPMENSGAVHILFGGFGGLSSTLQWWDVGAPVVDSEDVSNAEYGASLTTGDFNGDGTDDLAIGAPGQGPSPPGLEDSHDGAVHVVHGSRDLTETGSRGQVDQTLMGSAGPDPEFERTGTRVLPPGQGLALLPNYQSGFGTTLASGDFNDDGKDDLAVGTPGAYWWKENAGRGDHLYEAGAVSVIYGSDEGLSIDQSGGRAPRLITQRFYRLSGFGVYRTGISGEAESGDRFGTSLAAGDFNGDGNEDLAIGVPGEDVDDVPDAGAVNIVFGSDSGLTGDDNEWWQQGWPHVPDAAEKGDGFGTTLAAGDFDGLPETDELAIGVPYEDLAGRTDVGMVQLLRYKYNRHGTGNVAPWKTLSEPTGAEGTGRFGFALATGDVNGDGDPGIGSELAVSAPHSAGVGTVVSGQDRSESDGRDAAVHVLYGSNKSLSDGPGAERVQTWYEGNDTLQTINVANERLKDAIEHGSDGPVLGFAQGSTTLNALGLGQQPITIKDGTVTIEGTEGDDAATVSSDGDLVTVTLVRRDDSGEELLRSDRQFASADELDLVFQGHGGDDRFANETGIHSRAYGHRGDDVLIGGSARDVLHGGRGDDVLKGGEGNDRLSGHYGHDRLYGQDGRDRLYGQSGRDYLDGGEDGDRDYLRGGRGRDRFVDHVDRVLQRVRHWRWYRWSWQTWHEDALADEGRGDRVLRR